MLTALEPEDLPALRELLRLGPPEVEPLSDDALLTTFASFPAWEHRLALRRGTALVGYARLVVNQRMRCRHLATLYPVWSDPAAGRALLEAVIDHADRWMAISRLDVLAEEGDVRASLLEERFDLWVRHQEGVQRGAQLRDWLHWGWLRPDMPRPDQAMRVFPRPATRGTELLVRPARPEDAAAIVATLREPSVMWGTLQVGTTPASAWEPRLRPDAANAMLVVEHAGQVVGNGGIHQLPAPRAHMAMFGMGIATAAQGLGAGDRLLAGLITEARTRGFQRLGLEVWTDNSRAIGLYTRHGFVSEGVKPCSAWRDGAWAHDQAMSLAL